MNIVTPVEKIIEVLNHNGSWSERLLGAIKYGNDETLELQGDDIEKYMKDIGIGPYEGGFIVCRVWQGTPDALSVLTVKNDKDYPIFSLIYALNEESGECFCAVTANGEGCVNFPPVVGEKFKNVALSTDFDSGPVIDKYTQGFYWKRDKNGEVTDFRTCTFATIIDYISQNDCQGMNINWPSDSGFVINFDNSYNCGGCNFKANYRGKDISGHSVEEVLQRVEGLNDK